MSLSQKEDEKLFEYIDQQKEDDGNMNDEDDDASSGFSSFEGFDLDDMSEGDDDMDDEIELPGKTYEFVNFVDPTYADKHITKKASSRSELSSTGTRISTSSGGLSTPSVDDDPYGHGRLPYKPPDSQSSTRSLPGKLSSRTNLTQTSQPRLQVSGSYSPMPPKINIRHKSTFSKSSTQYSSNNRLLPTQSSQSSLHSGTNSNRLSAFHRMGPMTPDTIPENEEDDNNNNNHHLTSSMMNDPRDEFVECNSYTPSIDNHGTPDTSMTSTPNVNVRRVSNAYASVNTQSDDHGHLHSHSLHIHERMINGQHQHPVGRVMQRQGTESEIEADQGDYEWDRSGTLHDGRRKILQDRRRRRRHVWKDAIDFDIICLIASPCVKPEPIKHRYPHLRQLTQSNENNNSTRILPAITTYGSHPTLINAVSQQTTTLDDDFLDDCMATVEDVSSPKRRPGHQQYQSNSWTISSDLLPLTNTNSISAKKQNKKKGGKNNKKKKKQGGNKDKSKSSKKPKKNNKKTGKRTLNKKGSRHLINTAENPDWHKSSYNKSVNEVFTNNNNEKTKEFKSFVNSEHRQSKIIAASDSVLLKLRTSSSSNSKSTIPQRNSDNNIQSTHHHLMESSEDYKFEELFGDNQRTDLQHFDIKGMQTLLYDGILCSIHQKARFLTLQGNEYNIYNKIRGCKLLHYVGYASKGKLLIESNDCVGLGTWSDPKLHKNILDKMTQCVVIQSPTHIECAEIFIKDFKIKHVIAIKQPSDNFAHHITDFLTQFYFALIESNTTIARAFRTALKLFEDHNSLSNKFMDTILDDFKLLPETDDHELILFRRKLFRDGKPINKSKRMPSHNNLHAIRPFIGRWNDVYRVMNIIRDKKLSIICSENPGTGRTSVVTMAARYLWERSKFRGGVFHIKNNFKRDKFKGNFAELIMHTLDISAIDGYQDISKFYNNKGPHYRNKTQLAVEILYRYVTKIKDKNQPICLLLSDFDKMPFDIFEKYSFICNFIDRFDDEIEELPDIGTRLIITCALNKVGELQNFMDHLYRSTPKIQSKSTYDNNLTNPYTVDSPDSDGVIQHSHTAPYGVPESVRYEITDGADVINRTKHAKSEPQKPNGLSARALELLNYRNSAQDRYNLNNSLVLNNYHHGGQSPYDLNQQAINYNQYGGYRYNNDNKLPMAYKRGHTILKPLDNDDLIRLFLEMINIAATETIYKFEDIKKHKELLKLFDHKPLKVKQIAEYVLQTFDDNLSRQQFQYMDNEEADYGLIYTFDSESDSDSDEELERARVDRDGLKMRPYITSINTVNTVNNPADTSRLQLNLGDFSEDVDDDGHGPNTQLREEGSNSRENTKLPTTCTKLKHAANTDASQPGWSLGTSHKRQEKRASGAIVPFMSITESNRTKSLKSVSADDRPKRRKSKLIRIVSMRKVTSYNSSNTSSRSIATRRLSSNDSTPVNAHNVSYKLLHGLKGPPSTRSIKAPMTPDTGGARKSLVKVAASIPFGVEDEDNYADPAHISLAGVHSIMTSGPLETQMEEENEDIDGELGHMSTLHSTTEETYADPHHDTGIHSLMPSLNPEFSFLQSQSPAPSVPEIEISHKPETQVVLESTIVPSDDCHILLTKSSSKVNLSSRNIEVNLAMNEMDYRKTFLRQKINYAREKSHQAWNKHHAHARYASTHRTSRKWHNDYNKQYSMDMGIANHYGKSLPSTPNPTSKSAKNVLNKQMLNKHILHKHILNKHNSKLAAVPDLPQELENIQSGVEHYYKDGKLHKKDAESLVVFPIPQNKTIAGNSTRILPNTKSHHSTKSKNVSWAAQKGQLPRYSSKPIMPMIPTGSKRYIAGMSGLNIVSQAKLQNISQAKLTNISQAKLPNISAAKLPNITDNKQLPLDVTSPTSQTSIKTNPASEGIVSDQPGQDIEGHHATLSKQMSQPQFPRVNNSISMDMPAPQKNPVIPHQLSKMSTLTINSSTTAASSSTTMTTPVGSENTEAKEEKEQCFEDKIKAAWPCLSQIVTGFRKLQKKIEKEDMAIKARQQPLPLPAIAYDPHHQHHPRLSTLSHQMDTDLFLIDGRIQSNGHPAPIITHPHLPNVHPHQLTHAHHPHAGHIINDNMHQHQHQHQHDNHNQYTHPNHETNHIHRHSSQQQLHPNYLNNMHTAHIGRDHQIKFSKNMDTDDLPTANSEQKKQMNIQIQSPMNVSPPEKRNSLKDRPKHFDPTNRPKRSGSNTSSNHNTNSNNSSNNREISRPTRPKSLRSKRKQNTKRHHNGDLPALNTQINHNPISVEENSASTPLPQWHGNSNRIHIQDPSATPSMFSFPSDQSEIYDLQRDNALQPLPLQPIELKSNQSSLLVENQKAREIWIEAGGNEKEGVALEDMIADLYNYFSEKTMNNSMKFDKRSLGPLYDKFKINDLGHVDAAKFNQVWQWFDTVCDIVNEMKEFWNSDIATGHGFITREVAEHLLANEAVGTFIVRFSAPLPDISITYVDKKKRFVQNTNVSHIKLSRVNNTDLYEYASRHNHQRENLKNWIKKCPEFQYLYTTSAHIVQKSEYFK